MENITNKAENTPTPYCTLPVAARALGLPLSTLKQLMHRAPKRGIPLPVRKRCGKAFLYPIADLAAWLYQNAEALRGDVPAIAKKGEDESK